MQDTPQFLLITLVLVSLYACVIIVIGGWDE
jgi:hypothetical protein